MHIFPAPLLSSITDPNSQPAQTFGDLAAAGILAIYINFASLMIMLPHYYTSNYYFPAL